MVVSFVFLTCLCLVVISVFFYMQLLLVIMFLTCFFLTIFSCHGQQRNLKLEEYMQVTSDLISWLKDSMMSVVKRSSSQSVNDMKVVST